MAEVIDISRLKAKERKKDQARARRRAQAVASALACGFCPRRCAHCGVPLETPLPAPPEAPYPFCEPCLEEYRAYVRHLRDEEQPDPVFWHNEQWAQMWRCWLAYMEANRNFRASPAFLRLMEEQDE